MNKKAELLRSIIILPGMVLVFIPAIIGYFTWPMNFLCGLLFPAALLALIVGGVFVLAGVFFSYKTVSIFFTVGDGLPVPWTPPRNFVVSGSYCYVRNPMLISVLSILLGEAIIFGSFAILLWCAAFWIINTFYFILFEEPALVLRFGDDYIEYKKNVRRWLPRVRPWEQNKKDCAD
jgi:protein-S-isoprenylcysteine O-methyltransferase Ste14